MVQAPLVRCMGTEINAHLLVFSAVLLPLMTIVFPALLLSISITMLATLSGFDSRLPRWMLSDHGLLLASLTVSFVIMAAAVLLTERGCGPKGPRLRALAGEDGARLQAVVEKIWRAIPGTPSTLPTILWFPSMAIAAYTAHPATGPEVHISAGLWRAVSAAHPTAHAILAHEVAHLSHGDPRTLRWLQRLSVATRSVILVITVLAFITVGVVVVERTGAALRNAGTCVGIQPVFNQVHVRTGSQLVLRAVVIAVLPYFLHRVR